MSEISFSNCLNKLDTIIFNDEIDYIDGKQIRDILNETRAYVINSIDNKKIYDKQSFMIILKFINYLIQESFHPITNNFNNNIKGLIFLIIKFEDNTLRIADREIDFENNCNTFLYNIINNNGFDIGEMEKDIIE